MKLKESCGVFGIYSKKEDVARMAYYALYALQHRGQEGAGIAVADGKKLYVEKKHGMVGDAFDEEILSKLKGHIAIGHTRYSTCGKDSQWNIQPFLSRYSRGRLALAHNGTIVNCKALRDELKGAGHIFQSSTDTEVVAHLLARTDKPTTEESVREVMEKLSGSYSMVLLTRNKLIAFLDTHAFRPLCIGRLGDGYVVASETCALDVVGAKFERYMKPGEIVVVNGEGLKSIEGPKSRCTHCVFEYIYFARPDSILNNKTVYLIRKRMGELLAEQTKTEADAVVPIPDSGISASTGYAKQSKIPYTEGLFKNRYIGRTFIMPLQNLRELKVRVKLNTIKESIKGKRLVLIDDSIVRGTTMRHLINNLRAAGAREVHVRIPSPPIKYSCFYGVDTPTKGELIASKRTIPQIMEEIGADTLDYLTIDNLIEAIGIPKEKLCLACLNGDYPLAHAGFKKHTLEEGQ